MAYFDTAYLLKCYVKEEGWQRVRLPSEVFLRTGDAVHLISAREHGFQEIYSSDRHLLAPAPHVGIAGLDVIRAG